MNICCNCKYYHRPNTSYETYEDRLRYDICLHPCSQIVDVNYEEAKDISFKI